MSPTSTPSRRPRLLVVSAGVGAGHNQVARTLVDALKSADPEVEVTQVDVLRFTSRLFRAYYAGGFALSMSRLPRLYGLGYRIANRPHGLRRSPSERVRLWAERLALRKFARYVRRMQPDLIVHTHFLSAATVGGMIRRGRLRAPQMVVVTDNEVHRWWYAENVAHWFVPAPFSAETLRRWGIDENRITVSGVAVHPKWTAPLEREKILADWRLPGDKRIVLLSGGTDFTCGPVAKIARELVDACPQACVVVLAGRNKKLLAELSRHVRTGLATASPRQAGLATASPRQAGLVTASPRQAGRLVVVGFTDRLCELVEVCSLMVTKAGGVTTAECLAKATPMVFMKPVPGHEGGNALYFQRAGAAVVTRNTRELVQTVKDLLADPPGLAKLAENARRLHKPATQTIVAALSQALAPKKPAPKSMNES